MPRPRRGSVLSGALSLALLLGGGAAARVVPPDPATTRQQLQDIERSRAAGEAGQRAAAIRAAAAQADQQRLAQARVAAAAKLQDTDQAVQNAASALDDLAARRRQAEQRLAQRAADLGPLLPLIERLSLFPTETLLAIPEPPEDVIRGVLVLQGMTRQLAEEAAKLRTEQDQVTALSQQMAAALPALRSAQATQGAQAAALDRQIADARQTEQDAEDASDEAARQAAADAAQADTLRGAIAQIDAARHDAEARARDDAVRAERQKRLADAADARARQVALARPAGPGLPMPPIPVAPQPAAPQPGAPHPGAPEAPDSPAPAAPPDIGAPVAGKIVHRFGEIGDGGPANGISYAAGPAARVLAPCAGRAVFAGPFRSFGVLLILNCGGGYHFVLAGLNRLDVSVGRPVQAGEPVGVMPGWDPQVGGPRPVLYVELRHDGQPVNPAPWLKAKG